MRNRDAVEYLDRELRAIFERRLHAFVVYGQAHAGDAPVTTLAVVDAVSEADLRRCADRVLAWRGRGLATPLFLDADEFARSLDAFPFEFGAILADHEVISGRNPFEGLSVDPADLRRACETQIKSHLLHLRQGFIESGGRPHSVATLVTASAPAFAALLRNVARLSGRATSSRTEATHEGARAAGLSPGIVNDVLALERADSVPTTDAARLFPEYLSAVEQLARAVDSWRA